MRRVWEEEIHGGQIKEAAADKNETLLRETTISDDEGIPKDLLPKSPSGIFCLEDDMEDGFPG